MRACEYDDGQHVVLNPIQTKELKQNDPVETVNPDVATISGEVQELENQSNQKTLRYVRLNHFENQIIGDKNKDVMTRRRLVAEELCWISKIEPKDFVKACKDENWMRSMEEELNQIEKNNTWELVPRPKDKKVIGTKWVFKNKLNEAGEVVRNKARLVCKVYTPKNGLKIINQIHSYLINNPSQLIEFTNNLINFPIHYSSFNNPPFIN